MSHNKAPHEQIQIPQLQLIRVCGADGKADPRPGEMYVVCRNGNHLFGYPMILNERRYRFGNLTYYIWHSACWWAQEPNPDELEDLFLQQMCENEIDCHRIRMDAILTLLNLEC